MAGAGSIFLCAVLWSTSGLFIKLVDWHPVVIAGGRSILAVVVLLALRIHSRGRINSNTNNNGGAQKNLRNAAFGLCYAATMLLFVAANKLTASANAILLQYTAPIWAALLGWFVLREKPRREHWGALLIICTGMYLLFSGGIAKGSLAGDILALLSGIAFAANSVVLRLNKDGSPADILIFANLICAVFSVPFFFLYPPVFNADNILRILFMGIFQIGAASALFAYGIKYVSAVQAMLITAIEPVLNPVWVLMVTGEKPPLSVLAGGSLIIAAVIFSSMISTLRRRN